MPRDSIDWSHMPLPFQLEISGDWYIFSGAESPKAEVKRAEHVRTENLSGVTICLLCFRATYDDSI